MKQWARGQGQFPTERSDLVPWQNFDLWLQTFIAIASLSAYTTCILWHCPCLACQQASTYTNLNLHLMMSLLCVCQM